MDLFTEVYATLFQRSHSTFSILTILIPFFCAFCTHFLSFQLRLQNNDKNSKFPQIISIKSPSIRPRVYENVRAKLEKPLFLSPVVPHDGIVPATRAAATYVTSVALQHCIGLGAVAIMTGSVIPKSLPSIRMIACIQRTVAADINGGTVVLRALAGFPLVSTSVAKLISADATAVVSLCQQEGDRTYVI